MLLAVGDVEADCEILAARDAAFLHQPAETDARARRDLLLDHVGRRIEEDDRILERDEHERDRERQHAERGADQDETSLLAGHRALFLDARVLSLRDPAL